MTLPPLAEALGWLLAGLALGTVYLWLVARTVRAIATPGSPAAAAGAFALRLALAGVAFWLAAAQGAAPLLLMFAGFLAARSVALARARRQPDGR